MTDECGKEVDTAELIMREVEAALTSLDKGSLDELKRFHSPAAEVEQVVSACVVLTAPGGKIPKVSSMHVAIKLLCTGLLSSASAISSSCQQHVTPRAACHSLLSKLSCMLVCSANNT